MGVAGSPVIGRQWGAFSTLLRRPGLRASSDGVLATKSERKMLASTSYMPGCVKRWRQVEELTVAQVTLVITADSDHRTSLAELRGALFETFLIPYLGKCST